MIIKFDGDYTKKATIIEALKNYNKHLEKNYSSEIAKANKYHFDEYEKSDKQLNKIYVEYNNKKHYVIKIQIDVLTNSLIIDVDNYLIQQH